MGEIADDLREPSENDGWDGDEKGLYEFLEIPRPQVSRRKSLPAGPGECPCCGGETVKRRNRQTQKPFYGCKRFPECKGSRQMIGVSYCVNCGSPRMRSSESDEGVAFRCEDCNVRVIVTNPSYLNQDVPPWN